ncbi:MAG: class I SAM-dependent methyltransferase [Pirellulales bacterium]
MRQFATRKEMLAALPYGAVVAEVGVQRGRFAKMIDRHARPRKLHLIDCWEHQADARYQPDTANVVEPRQQANMARTAQRLRRGIREGRVTLHRGYSVPMLQTFPAEYFDWVYIDANHTCEGALADLEAALPRVRWDGMIAGHDYIDTPYWRAMNFGVVEAVQTFCARHGWEIVGLTNERGNEIDRRGNPSFALRRRGLGWPAVTPRPAAWWQFWRPSSAA